jgi:hypothetical protein
MRTGEFLLSVVAAFPCTCDFQINFDALGALDYMMAPIGLEGLQAVGRCLLYISCGCLQWLCK